MTDERKSKEVRVSDPQALVELDTFLEAMDIERNDIVSAKVICWDSKRNGLIVILGNRLRGFIPTEHISIYSSYDKGEIPSEATYIIGKNIVAEVIDYNLDKTEFILSRFNAMYKRTQEINKSVEVTGSITQIREKDLFVDLGSGITGRLDCREFSNAFVDTMKCFGYIVGSTIKLKVLGSTDNKYNLSRKKLYPEYDMTMVNCGDIVEVRVISELKIPLAIIDTPYAYCIELKENPNVKGIIDMEIELELGSFVTAVINDVDERGVRLKLISI